MSGDYFQYTRFDSYVEVSLDWDNKLGSKDKYPNSEHIKIINKLKRDSIFEHEYTAKDLFSHIYKNPTEKAKRQLNSFMLFRTVLAKVAAEQKIELGGGALLSKLAGFIWAGASLEEKKKFEDLATEFKNFHKTTFPDYEYKPRSRNNHVFFHF
jgi:hypothetical protein